MRLLKDFIRMEASGGIVLFITAVAAIVITNSPYVSYYQYFLDLPVSFRIGTFELFKPLLHWVNDGLMVIFFLLVGLEIKREVLEGELNSLQKSMLPGIAALGGMLIPAIIYLIINAKTPSALHGWAIPTATDIAFALGILSLLGSRVPTALKVFLTALAILDDLGAIAIIAMFYTSQLSMLSLSFAFLFISILYLMNRLGVTKFAPYLIVGFILWLCVLKSGVHATLSGVVLAFAIPLRARNEYGMSPARTMEHALMPWVAYGVLPLFAFVNAGLCFRSLSASDMLETVPLGIALGLFFGKQIGVLGASWLAVKTKIAQLPAQVDWPAMYGVALLCGVGFTMSLFIGGLAFDAQGRNYATAVRLGVLFGSALSGVLGYWVLRTVLRKPSHAHKPQEHR